MNDQKERPADGNNPDTSESPASESSHTSEDQPQVPEPPPPAGSDNQTIYTHSRDRTGREVFTEFKVDPSKRGQKDE